MTGTGNSEDNRRKRGIIEGRGLIETRKRTRNGLRTNWLKNTHLRYLIKNDRSHTSEIETSITGFSEISMWHANLQS